MSRAITVALGTSSHSSSTRFACSVTVNRLTPVKLPPGRLKLVTKPNLIGSLPTAKTIGMVAVAAFAARVAGVLPGVTITVT
jgi:hypothetical protein